jgi:hypothetical protein
MIDDDVLEDLLRRTADDIAVPEDGPARLLAARQAMGADRSGPRVATGLRRWVRAPRARPVVAVVAAIAAVGLLIGVVGALGGSGKSPSPSSASKTTSPRAAVSPTTVAGSAAGGSQAAQGAPAFGLNTPASPNSAPTPPAASSGPSVPTKVIKTGTVSLQVGRGRLNSTVGQLTSDASGLGGFVASTNTNVPSGGAPSGDLVLRVPAANFEPLLNEARALGTATGVSTSGQDVTSQYVDLAARLQSLQDSRTQFQQILTRAQNIGDILAVEQQISDLQTQIEQLQGQLRVMDDQTTYGTLTVHVSETTPAVRAVVPPPPPSGLSRAWNHARHTFARGLESVVGALGGIGVFLLCVLALTLLGRLSWGVIRRRLV